MPSTRHTQYSIQILLTTNKRNLTTSSNTTLNLRSQFSTYNSIHVHQYSNHHYRIDSASQLQPYNIQQFLTGYKTSYKQKTQLAERVWYQTNYKRERQSAAALVFPLLYLKVRENSCKAKDQRINFALFGADSIKY